MDSYERIRIIVEDQLNRTRRLTPWHSEPTFQAYVTDVILALAGTVAQDHPEWYPKGRTYTLPGECPGGVCEGCGVTHGS